MSVLAGVDTVIIAAVIAAAGGGIVARIIRRSAKESNVIETLKVLVAERGDQIEASGERASAHFRSLAYFFHACDGISRFGIYDERKSLSRFKSSYPNCCCSRKLLPRTQLCYRGLQRIH